MEFSKFLRKGEILFTMGFVLILAVYVVYLMVGDVKRMQDATTNYDYYQNLIYLIENIARSYFFCIFLMMAFLTYVHKQYSKWCIRLYYLLGISALLYFGWCSIFSTNVFNHIEPQYIENFPRMIHSLYLGPIYWMIIGYLFTPKILKDAQKLKEEQELTV
jgi:cytochrome c biogenesis protein CcdA